jgi:hypothetical protein
MSKRNFLAAASLIFLLALVVLPSAASAAVDVGLGYPSAIGLSSTDIRTTVAKIINVALGLLGTIAVVIILLGGFKWMTAGGNEEGVTEAKNLIAAGVIGLVIILTSYAIATFVINSLMTATA